MIDRFHPALEYGGAAVDRKARAASAADVDLGQ
jgi:hypothetical protein